VEPGTDFELSLFVARAGEEVEFQVWDVKAFGVNLWHAAPSGKAEVACLCLAVVKFGATCTGFHTVRVRVIDPDGAEVCSIQQVFGLGKGGEAASTIEPLWVRFDAKVGRYEIRASIDDGPTLDAWQLYVHASKGRKPRAPRGPRRPRGPRGP
jgi:hypothetical protein